MYVSDSSYTLAALHATLQRKNVIPMVYKYVKLCTRLKRKHTFINSTFFFYKGILPSFVYTWTFETEVFHLCFRNNLASR